MSVATTGAWQGTEPATTENERTRARFHWLRVVVKVWQGAEPTTTETSKRVLIFGRCGWW